MFAQYEKYKCRINLHNNNCYYYLNLICTCIFRKVLFCSVFSVLRGDISFSGKVEYIGGILSPQQSSIELKFLDKRLGAICSSTVSLQPPSRRRSLKRFSICCRQTALLLILPRNFILAWNQGLTRVL